MNQSVPQGTLSQIQEEKLLDSLYNRINIIDKLVSISLEDSEIVADRINLLIPADGATNIQTIDSNSNRLISLLNILDTLENRAVELNRITKQLASKI